MLSSQILGESAIGRAISIGIGEGIDQQRSALNKTNNNNQEGQGSALNEKKGI